MTNTCPRMNFACGKNNYTILCNEEGSFWNCKPCSLIVYLWDTPVGDDFLTRKDVEKECPEHFKFEEVLKKAKALESIISENYQKKKFSIEGDIGAKENTTFQFTATFK